MASTLKLMPGYDGPTYANAITHPVGGSATFWGTGPYSFAVAANYNPAGTWTDLDYIAVTAASQWANITPTANDKILIDWTAPTRYSRPVYYRVYYQAGATYDLGAPGILVRAYDSSDALIGSDIPGSRESSGTVAVRLMNRTAQETSTQVSVTAVDTAAKQIHIDGIDLISFGAGTVFTSDVPDSYTVASVKLVHNARGWETRITTVGSIAGTVVGTQLVYNRGPASFTDDLDPGTDDAITIYTTADMTPHAREAWVRGHNSKLRKKSWADTRVHDAIDIEPIMPSLQDDPQRDYMRLYKWQRDAVYLRLEDVNEAGAEPLNQYSYGGITGLVHPGNGGKNAKMTWPFRFLVDTETEF